jgi:hypothetical protein
MKFYVCVGRWIYGCIKADIGIQLEADLFVDTAVKIQFSSFVHD